MIPVDIRFYLDRGYLKVSIVMMRKDGQAFKGYVFPVRKIFSGEN